MRFGYDSLGFTEEIRPGACFKLEGNGIACHEPGVVEVVIFAAPAVLSVCVREVRFVPEPVDRDVVVRFVIGVVAPRDRIEEADIASGIYSE